MPKKVTGHAAARKAGAALLPCARRRVISCASATRQIAQQDSTVPRPLSRKWRGTCFSADRALLRLFCVDVRHAALQKPLGTIRRVY